VFANLKSLLETGHVLPQALWEMHAGIRDARLARNTPPSLANARANKTPVFLPGRRGQTTP